MLDKSKIDEQEELYLKCEKCGQEYSNKFQADEDENIGADYDYIEITGHCYNCDN